MVYRAILFVLLFVTAFRLVASGAEEAVLRQRLTPSEIDALAPTGPGAGTSGVPGIQMRVLKGDPE